MTPGLPQHAPSVIDVRVDDEKAGELVDALRPRLASVAADSDIPRLVREALDELAPVKVYNYLPVLVERRVRDRLHVTGLGGQTPA